MATHILEVALEPTGKMVWKENGVPLPPNGVVLHRGDIVRWKSDQGELKVEFDSTEPFGVDRTFKSAIGQLTSPPAVITPNAPRPKAFACRVTLQGRTETYGGVDIQPPP